MEILKIMPRGYYKNGVPIKLGKKTSIATKKKISKLLSGRRLSPKTEFKKGHTINNGKHRSSKTEFKKRHIPWNKIGENGISSENNKLRSNLEYKLWRRSVYKRDDYTCQKCGNNKSGNLNSHHIQNFSKIKELRTSIENGITFCKDCHIKFHKRYGKKNNTIKQLIEFLNK